MSKRDSHPGNHPDVGRHEPTLRGMGGDATDPGPPPDATPQLRRRAAPPNDPAADLAASLLHDLARSSLPTEGVPETSGQLAAAYAVSARKPPRAMEDMTLEPAVVVNMTEPFPVALTPLPRDRRDDPTFIDPRRRETVRIQGPITPAPMATMMGGSAARQQKTVLGPRAQRRQVMVGIISVIGIATLVAIGILAFAGRVRRDPAASTATSELTAASAEGVTMVTSTATAPSVETPAAPPLTAPPPPAASAPVVVTAAVTVPAARPRGPASSRAPAPPRPAAAAPKPTGTFEEPDRTF